MKNKVVKKNKPLVNKPRPQNKVIKKPSDKLVKNIVFGVTSKMRISINKFMKQNKINSISETVRVLVSKALK